MNLCRLADMPAPSKLGTTKLECFWTDRGTPLVMIGESLSDPSPNLTWRREEENQSLSGICPPQLGRENTKRKCSAHCGAMLIPSPFLP